MQLCVSPYTAAGVVCNENINNKRTGGAKKAAASFFVPGLGQFLDGRNKEGAAFLSLSAGLSVLGICLRKNAAKTAFKGGLEGMMDSAIRAVRPVSKSFAVKAVALAAVVVKIADMMNAYKG